MTTWEYRVLKRTFPNEEVYNIYEVYYNKKGKIRNISSMPMYIQGESLEELKYDYELYGRAFRKPILDYNKIVGDFNE